jgi:hypothetical protein
MPTILGIWDQKEILLRENEVDYFMVRLRGCPLLILDNPPKILREYSSISKPSKDFDKKGLFKNDPRG